MRLARQILSGALILSLLGPSARAQAQDHAVQTQQLQADCAALRIQLDRVNSEIAVLKQADRNVRTEYRLREKMADAEAVARKLTELERQLRTARPIAPAPVLVAPPVATPQDGVVELEAKADLLADQAHRFTAEADRLARTVEEIRKRQALRRRASNWDRDPFAGFEGSKRSLAVQQRSNGGATAGDSTRSSGTTEAAKASVPATGSATSGGSSGLAPATSSRSTSGGSASAERGSTGSASVVSDGTTSSPSSSTSGSSFAATSSASAAPSSSPSAATPLAPAAASKPGLLPRTLLDPASLVDIRQSLGASGSLSDPDAIEAAVTALRQHARALQDQASALRARARQD
jgi:hypothetical protein